MAEINENKNLALAETDDFYKKAEIYWANVDPTVNGVLGGFGWMSPIDVRGSNRFLKEIFNGPESPGKIRALDCGAGVGRITQQLLAKHFETVDLVEQNATFLSTAKENLSNHPNVGHFFESGLQDFVPSEKYDVIWIQWVLGHLTDEDLREFLKRCGRALNPNGLIVVKENVSSSKEIIEDETDSSITRPCGDYVKIFKDASFRILRQANQNNFPRQLFAVKLFALCPVS